MEEPWQVPSSLDRVHVNAALGILIERYDNDAAREVIAALRTFPAEETYPLGYGTTSAEPDSDDLIVKAVGGPRYLARIGLYKVFRIERRGCLPCIVIRPFWTNDLGVSPDERPDEFHLVYNSVASTPIALYRYAWRMTKPSLLDRFTCLVRLRTLAPVTTLSLSLAETIFIADGYARS